MPTAPTAIALIDRERRRVDKPPQSADVLRLRHGERFSLILFQPARTCPLSHIPSHSLAGNRLEGDFRIVGLDQHDQPSPEQKVITRVPFHDVENSPGGIRTLCGKRVIAIEYNDSSTFV